jgi:hypothetical protein
MIHLSKKAVLFLAGGIVSCLVGTVGVGVALKTHAQDAASQEQEAALKIVTKMTEGQRTYYQKTGKFNVVVKDMAKDLNLTLPASFNYGVRTSVDAAYIYVMPAKTSLADQLKAYVGGAFINPNQKSSMLTIICESTKPGRLRPSDPKLMKEQDSSQASSMALQCGDSSVQVSGSK